VNLSVFDTNGKLVEKLIEARLEKGEHSVIWKAGELKGGTYFYQLKTAGFLETKRMVLVK
jgi:hypothetical protein